MYINPPESTQPETKITKVVRAGKRAIFKNNGDKQFVIRHLETEWYTEEFEQHLQSNGVDVFLQTEEAIIEKQQQNSKHTYDPFKNLTSTSPTSVKSSKKYCPTSFTRK